MTNAKQHLLYKDMTRLADSHAGRHDDFEIFWWHPGSTLNIGLPDNSEGWYWWPRSNGDSPSGEAHGPFETSQAAFEHFKSLVDADIEKMPASADWDVVNRLEESKEQDILIWLINSLLTDSQLDAKMPNGETIRQWYARFDWDRRNAAIISDHKRKHA